SAIRTATSSRLRRTTWDKRRVFALCHVEGSRDISRKLLILRYEGKLARDFLEFARNDSVTGRGAKFTLRAHSSSCIFSLCRRGRVRSPPPWESNGGLA